jgi:hypothetical protein
MKIYDVINRKIFLAENAPSVVFDEVYDSGAELALM